MYSREGVGLQSVFRSVICAVFFIAEYAPFVHIAVGDVAEKVEEFAKLYDIAVFSEYVFKIGIDKPRYHGITAVFVVGIILFKKGVCILQ